MSITVERPQETVVFCTNLALKAEHERAVAALQEAQRAAATDAREVPSTDVAGKAQAVRDIEDRMRDHEIVFTIQGWPRKRWIEFEEKHKPRPGNEADKTLGINVADLDDALAAVGGTGEHHKLPRSIVSVQSRSGEDVPFDPATHWVPLADEMTNGQWEEFAMALLRVNRGVKAAPFSVAASRVIQRSEPSSN